MQYFRTSQLDLALLARVLDRGLARRRVANGTGRKGSTFPLDANQRSICAVSVHRACSVRRVPSFLP